MKDIENRGDLELLVDTFYGKVKGDPVIGYLFEEVAGIDWEKHLPKMYDFWETTLFHKAGYKGNPMKVHMDLNEKEPLQKAHFDHWLTLFNETVDELFAGTQAEIIKQKGLSIATVMQIKAHRKGIPISS